MLSGKALADDPPTPPEYWRGHVNGWVFAPAFVNGSLVGFLGWADTAPIVGSNISIVWLQKETGGSWSTWGWSTGNFAGAVGSLRTSFGNSLWHWEDDIEAKLAQAAPVDDEPPTAMTGGLLEGDPVATAIAGDPSAPAIVQTLASLGWTAAPTISVIAAQSEVAEASCDPTAATTEVLCDRMEYEAETAILGQTAVTASSACITSLCWGCWSHPLDPNPWSAWSLSYSETTPAGVLICHYVRTRERQMQYSGYTFIDCHDCSVLSGWQTQTQTGTTRTVGNTGTCPSPPPASTDPPGDWG
jgi:hypothetical protein